MPPAVQHNQVQLIKVKYCKTGRGPSIVFRWPGNQVAIETGSTGHFNFFADQKLIRTVTPKTIEFGDPLHPDSEPIGKELRAIINQQSPRIRLLGNAGGGGGACGRSRKRTLKQAQCVVLTALLR